MRELKESDVRDLCGTNFSKGVEYFRQGQVGQAARTEERLFAEVQGSGSKPYRITITVKEDKVTPKCSCPAARRTPFCKHVAAVLLTWAQTPDKFVVGQLEGETESEQLAALKADTKVPRTKREKASREDVLLAGLGAVEELVVDLSRRGLVAATPERLAVLEDMGTNLQAHKLRRLSRAMTSLKGEMQRALQAPEAFNPARYAELLGDIWFTARAVRRYVNGELKDERSAEDLIGKTWRDPDLEERRDLDLLELAYESFTTDTGFRLDVSYFICTRDGAGAAMAGEILREMKIVPTQLKGPQADPKPRHDHPLHVARLGIYPGFPPKRVKLLQIADCRLQIADCVGAAIGHAQTSVPELWKQFTEATAEFFAPDETYALVAPHGLWAAEEGLRWVDEEGYSLRLAPPPPPYPDLLPQAQTALVEHLPRALFGRLTVQEQGVAFSPLSLLTDHGVVKLGDLVG